MSFSMSNVLGSLVDGATRKPHAIQLDDADDIYVHRPPQRPNILEMMDETPRPAVKQNTDGRSSEEREHDMLSNIRDALYNGQQA